MKKKLLRPCSSVGRAFFKRSREFGATLLIDVGLIPGRGIGVRKNLERKDPSHAICEANSEINARIGNNQKMRKKFECIKQPWNRSISWNPFNEELLYIWSSRLSNRQAKENSTSTICVGINAKEFLLMKLGTTELIVQCLLTISQNVFLIGFWGQFHSHCG